MKQIILLLVFLVLAMPALALSPEQATRADRLNHEIRCVACQGQSIADSDADIAKDMRHEIEAQIVAGKSDAAIRQGLLDRYGDYVLFRPRFTLSNLLLWLFPPLLAILGAALWFLNAKKATKSEIRRLSPEETKALEAILKSKDN